MSTSEFEGIVLRELAKAWTLFAYKFKWNGMQSPIFKISDVTSYYGQWTPSSREMSFAASLLNNRPWNEVLEVLKHEMAHQYVSEILNVQNETSHGPTFQSVCQKYGIDSTAKSEVDSSQTTTTNHIVEKIQHLLKLASNAGATDAEKETAAAHAHNLMLKYNIELQEKNEERGYTIRYVGKLVGRIQGYMSEIAYLLSKYYFVEIIWISSYDPRNKKKGHELEISGKEENVEVAEYVYDFLTRAAVESWESKFKESTFQYKLHQAFLQSGMQSMHGFTISSRSNYLSGFIDGFKSQLATAAKQEQEAGLVLAKDLGLEQFYNQRHPHIRSMASGGAKYNPSMRNQGFADGSALKMPAAAKANKQFIPLLGK